MKHRLAVQIKRLGRVAVFGIGLAVVLATALGAVTTTLAAVPGDPLKLGQLNTIDAVTNLVGTRAGALLQVKNNDGPALNLNVPAGRAPIVLSAGAGKVVNFNADKLDGKDAAAFLPTKAYSRIVEVRGDAGDLFQASAHCDAGDVAISGGYLGLDRGTEVTDSHPVAQSETSLPSSWSVIWRSPSAAGDLIGIMVACLDLP